MKQAGVDRDQGIDFHRVTFTVRDLDTRYAAARNAPAGEVLLPSGTVQVGGDPLSLIAKDLEDARAIGDEAALRAIEVAARPFLETGRHDLGNEAAYTAASRIHQELAELEARRQRPIVEARSQLADVRAARAAYDDATRAAFAELDGVRAERDRRTRLIAERGDDEDLRAQFEDAYGPDIAARRIEMVQQRRRALQQHRQGA